MLVGLDRRQKLAPSLLRAQSGRKASALSRPAGCVVSLALMTLDTVEVLDLDVQILDTYFNAN